MPHCVLVDKATGRVIGTAPIQEAAIIKRNTYKELLKAGVAPYTVLDNDPDVEIRVYEEP